MMQVMEYGHHIKIDQFEQNIQNECECIKKVMKHIELDQQHPFPLFCPELFLPISIVFN